jgi:hypothetical protein
MRYAPAVVISHRCYYSYVHVGGHYHCRPSVATMAREEDEQDSNYVIAVATAKERERERGGWKCARIVARLQTVAPR